MLDLEQIRERMRDRKVTAVAEATGLHQATVYRVVWGEQIPSYETVKTLSDYLLGEGRFAPAKAKDGGA